MTDHVTQNQKTGETTAPTNAAGVSDSESAANRTRHAQHVLDAGLVGILYWNIAGGVTDANDTLLEILGYTREELTSGQIDWIHLTPPELREHDAGPIAELHATGKHQPIEKEYITKDGSRIPVLIASAFHEDSQTEGVSFVVEISCLRLAREEARQRSQEIITIFESMTDSFFALDRDLRFTYVNAEAERLLSRSRAELLGRYVWDEFPEAVGSTSDIEYNRALRDGVTVSFADFYHPLGVWFEVRAYPSRASGGTEVTGLSVYFRNISERKQAEQERESALAALRESDERLRLALASGGMGTWDADLATGILTLSEEVPPLYGRPRAAVTIPFAEWVPWLHPDDRKRITNVFASVLRGEMDEEVQFRTLWPDGISTRWVSTRAMITRDANGTPLRAVGYTRDVTLERERIADREASLTRQRQFMSDLIYTLTEGKFCLCLSETDLPAPLTPAADRIPLTVPTLCVLRQQLNRVSENLSFAKDRAYDIMTAVSESAMNAATHGGGGEGLICADPSGQTIQVWISDSGGGISEEALPHVLEKGVSTAGSMGHGFWLMLCSCDRIYLLTGPSGTTIVLEQDRTPCEPTWPVLTAWSAKDSAGADR